jgi:sugar phosphate isomerase/epimerase
MQAVLGLSMSIFGRRPPVEDDLRQLKEAGIRKVEMCLLRKWLDPYDETTFAQVCRWMDKHDIRVHSVHGPSGMPGNAHWLADPDEEARRIACAERRVCITKARQMGADYLVVEYEGYDRWPYWPHNSPSKRSYTRATELWVRSIEELLEDVVRCDLKLAIENIDGLSCARQRDLVAAWDPQLVGVCFDSSHATYGGRFYEELDALAPQLIGTHLSDNDALEGSSWIDRHWFPFQGSMDWPRLMETLLTTTTCRTFIVEALSPEHRVTPDLVSALDRLRCMVEG